MTTYSFKDVTASLNGFGGSINLANGAGVSEEGITIEPTNDKNIMTMGAGGEGMHSLVADESSTITVRLLKTSPTNAQLQTMYNLQTGSSATHGRNVIVINNVAGGDVITASGVAFKKRPTITYAQEGGIMEWAFDAIRTSSILGVGTPEV
jgi:hypothetical protein